MSRSSAVATIDSLPVKAPSRSLNLPLTRNILLLVVAIATVLQLILNFDIANLEMSALLLVGLWIGVSYTFKKELFTRYPISTLMILGYVIYHYIIPPIGQLSELQSITHELHYPIWVEIYDLSGLISILVAHVIYRKFSICGGIRKFLEFRFYEPLGFFLIPTNIECWMLGLVGIASTYFSTHFGASSRGGVAVAVLHALIYLTYVPYLIVSPVLVYPQKGANQKTRWLPLILYTLVVIAVSLVANSRGFMLSGIASLVLAYIYRVLSGDLPAPKITLKMIIVIICAALFITGPVMNLAASMVIARSSRAKESRMALLEQTWKIYQSGSAIRILSARTVSGVVSGAYNEAYYNNLLLNRLGNLLFDDLSIRAEKGAALAGDIGYFRKVEYGKSVALLPEPFIHMLGLGVNKKAVTSGSSEDFLYQEATGNPIGGFKVGSLPVLLHATFGAFWPVVLTIAAVLLFILADALCTLKRSAGRLGIQSVVFLSPFLVVSLFSYVFLFAGAGVLDFPGILSAVTRSWLQTGILYGVVYFAVRRFSRVFFPVRQ